VQVYAREQSVVLAGRKSWRQTCDRLGNSRFLPSTCAGIFGAADCGENPYEWCSGWPRTPATMTPATALLSADAHDVTELTAAPARRTRSRAHREQYYRPAARENQRLRQWRAARRARSFAPVVPLHDMWAGRRIARAEHVPVLGSPMRSPSVIAKTGASRCRSRSATL